MERGSDEIDLGTGLDSGHGAPYTVGGHVHGLLGYPEA
jgi:hypothetical protein